LESTETVLDVAGLGRSYDGRRARRRGSTFELRAGEIVGPGRAERRGQDDGTLRSIAGVLPLQEGRVTHRRLTTSTRDEVAAKRALMRWVPDDPQPFDALTVRGAPRVHGRAVRRRRTGARGRRSCCARFELTREA
jgi:ABC-type branched-subunit amino acid transport system ATPase component